MNFFKKLLLAAVPVIVMSACSDYDELLINPNGVDPSQADAESLYNNIQLEFNDIQNDPYFLTAGLSRMDALTAGFVYPETHAPTDFDGMWQDIYADFLPDANAFIDLVEPLGIDGAAASVKIMKAYVYMLAADLFNNVPVDEAGQGAADDGGNINPVANAGPEVYQRAMSLLDEAITQLDGASNFDIAFDNFYGGNVGRWTTLAKTLKLRAAITTRLVNGTGEIQSLVDGGDLIDANNENFEWTYGSNRNNPNNRHPFYNDSYEEPDPTYQSNWFMWLMSESKGFVDPRTRYYFYRQNRDVWEGAVEDDPNAFDCIYTDLPNPDAIPPHYEAISDDMPYCLGSYDLSYFGRDHLNGSGIPPDGQYRTIFGLYPAGGIFDNGVNNGERGTDGTSGALGAGIEPIWQASFTHFVLAEAALTTDFDGDARALLSAGIKLSMDRVTAFETLVDGGEVIATVPTEVTVSDTYVSDSTVQVYIDYVMDEYDDADESDKLAIVAREYMIALFGNGLEAYNLYRRTCLPANMQPGIDPNYGNFIRSFLYPSVYVNRNLNAVQRSTEEPVFWDTNEAGCAY